MELNSADTYQWTSWPRAAAMNRPLSQTRSAGVNITAGLDNTCCATRLRRLEQEELRGPGPNRNRWKEETTATRAVTGRDQDVVIVGAYRVAT